MPKYKRILLKLSGESLGGEQKQGIAQSALKHFTGEVSKAVKAGVRVAVVIGGGNIFRGLSAQAENMDRVRADQMGMLATVINSLALTDALIKSGIDAALLTAFPAGAIGELYTKFLADKYLREGKVVLIAGGTGNPFFTTDTAAVLRAVEIEADAILKGTRVDGVYSADPERDSNAVKFERISYDEVLAKNLRVMDLTAISLAKDNNLPIVVFDLGEEDNLLNIVNGENRGTIVGR
jgi:uridylate kinase